MSTTEHAIGRSPPAASDRRHGARDLFFFPSDFAAQSTLYRAAGEPPRPVTLATIESLAPQGNAWAAVSMISGIVGLSVIVAAPLCVLLLKVSPAAARVCGVLTVASVVPLCCAVGLGGLGCEAARTRCGRGRRMAAAGLICGSFGIFIAHLAVPPALFFLLMGDGLLTGL